MAALVPPDLIDRFRRDLEALVRGDLGPDERVAVAVSGGPDSLALLLLARAAFAGRIDAVTVDHGLRSESAEEASSVTRLCEELQVGHRVLSVAVPQHAGNLQRHAREARYRAIGAWLDAAQLRWLMTAHHLDDQAETFVMRLLRGAGVRGLAGVPARGGWPAGASRATVLRPLLGWRRAELAALVEAAGLRAADDPSNRDDRFERARIRKQLALAPWLDPLEIGRSAAALREADEALDWAVARLWEQRITVHADFIEYEAVDAPPEIVRRLLLSILQASGSFTQPRHEELARLAAALGNGGIATLAGIKCTGGAIWRFEPAPPRRSVRAPG